MRENSEDILCISDFSLSRSGDMHPSGAKRQISSANSCNKKHKCSPWRKYFEILEEAENGEINENGNSSNTAICLLYQSPVKLGIRSSTTSNMKSHMEHHHFAIFEEEIEIKFIENTANSQLTSNSNIVVAKNDDIAFSIARYICECSTGFQEVDQEAFRQMGSTIAKYACQLYDEFLSQNSNATAVQKKTFIDHQIIPKVHPCNKTIIQKCYESYQAVSMVLRNQMKNQHVIYSVDCWTGADNNSYISLACQFINDSWEMKCFQLECKPITCKTALSQASIFKDLVNKWNNTDNSRMHKNVLGCITDTENTMRAFGQLIHPFTWFPCLNHMLELVVKHSLIPDPPPGRGKRTNAERVANPVDTTNNLLKDEVVQSRFKETKYYPAIEKAKTLVNIFSASPKREALLKKAQLDAGEIRALKVVKDCKTRWWSEYAMIHRLIRLQMYFLALGIENEEYNILSAEDWKTLQNMDHILEPFYLMEQEMEGCTYVTGSMVCGVLPQILLDLSENEKRFHQDKTSLAVVQKLQQNLVSYFFMPTGDLNIDISRKIANLLDPRFKGCSLSDNEIDECINAMTEFYCQHFNSKAASTSSQQSQEVQRSNEITNVVLTSTPSLQTQEVQSKKQTFIKKLSKLGNSKNKAPNPQVSTIKSRIKNDMLDFLETLPNDDEDPLSFYLKCRNESRLTMLVPLAKAFLAIPATSANSERTFSAAGQVLLW